MSPEGYYEILFILLLLVLAQLAGYILQKFKIEILHDSGAAIILGAIVGLITNEIGGEGIKLRNVAQFNPDVFFVVLLPPIIFESGLSMKTSHFFSNFGAILTFAIFGTLLSTLVIAAMLYYLGEGGVIFQMSAVENSLFAALISAVDPVTVLAIFKSLGADPTLDSIVFGESVLNDAVAIVLFRSLAAFVTTPISSYSVGMAIVMFIKIFLGSFLVGIAVGLLSALVFRYLKVSEHHHLELPLLCVFAYSPYCLSESFGLSGIVGVLFGGVVIAHYTSYSMSPDSRHAAKRLFHAIAAIAETLIFLFLGIDLFNRKLFPFYHWGYIGFAMLACLIGRAVNIFALSLILNVQRKKDNTPITMKQQTMMWWAGLRGAIAFALCLNLPPEIHSDNVNAIITTTLSIIVFTVLMCGGTSPFLVRKLDLLSKADPHDRSTEIYDTSHSQHEPLLSGESVHSHSHVEGAFFCERHNDKCLHARWKKLDEKFIKPLFGGKPRHSHRCWSCDQSTPHSNKSRAKSSRFRDDDSSDIVIVEDEEGGSPRAVGSSSIHRLSNPVMEGESDVRRTTRGSV